MLSDPVGEVVVGQPGLALRAPELGRPREHAEVVVHPVVRAALDRLLRLVLEVVEDRNRRIAGELGAALADQLVSAQIRGGKLVVGRPAYGLRCTPLKVWYAMCPVMFGRSTTACTIARTSGSDVG